MALECVNLLRINGQWVEQKDIPKETFDKMINEIMINGMLNIGFKPEQKSA